MEALKESENVYRAFIDANPDMVFLKDEQFRHIVANSKLAEFFNKSESEVIGKTDYELMPEEAAKQCRKADMLSLTKKTVITSEEIVGDRVFESIKFPVELMNTKFGVGGYIRDITEQKAAEEKLVYTSRHDYLTGLLNRRSFDVEEERLNVSDQLPLSVIIGDINGLKLINNSFGRKAGDTIIIETARIIRSFCRPGDVLAKTGGDEFSILLPKTNNDTAIELMNQIQAACQEYRVNTTNESYQITISFGACTKEAANEEIIDVYKQAEDNMNQHKLLEKRSSQSEIIASIRATMLEKSHETEAHSERLVQLARKVGLILNLSQTDLDHLELLATLHDIGKIGISEHILNKPGSLNKNEWIEMKKHPEIGYRIALSTANLAPIAEYILCHHERWDGSGYPQKLVGEDIPLLSRILSVVDAYDAMTQDRVYRKAMTHEKAMEELKNNAGTQFDPQIVQVFCAVV